MLIYSIPCQSQYYNGEVTYKSIRLDYTLENSSKKDLAILNYLNDINKSAGNIEFNLLFNDTESLFKVIDKLDIDKSENFTIALAMRGGETVYYTNLSNNELLVQSDAFNELFLISSTLEKYNWLLTKESRMIKGYQCFKATTIKKIVNSKGEFNHVVTAWYTPEIPKKFGPAGYGNLPGLILELTVNKLKFIAFKIELNQNKTNSIRKPIRGKNVTEQEFQKIVNNTKSRF